MSASPCKFNCHVNLVNRLCNTQFNKQAAMPMSNRPMRRARASDETEQEAATLSLLIVSASFCCETCDNLLSILRNTPNMNGISGQNIETIDNTKLKSPKEIFKVNANGFNNGANRLRSKNKQKQQMKSVEN